MEVDGILDLVTGMRARAAYESDLSGGTNDTTRDYYGRRKFDTIRGAAASALSERIRRQDEEFRDLSV